MEASSAAFQRLQGGSLRDLLDYQQRHPTERMYDYIDVLQWLLEVARGLRYLHSRSLTHRSGSDLGRNLPGKWHKFVCSSIQLQSEQRWRHG